MPELHARVFPGEAADPGALDEALADLQALAVPFTRGGFGDPVADDGGLTLSLELPDDDPDATIGDVRRALGLAKWLALRDPTWWVQVWDDLSLVEATFGRPLAFLGGVVVDDEGGYDEDLETRLAETVAKVPLPGVELGFPPGVPEEALRAMDEGPTEAERGDAGFVARVVAVVDRCGKLRRSGAAEALAAVLDQVEDAVLLPILVEGWADHAPAVRSRLAAVLARAEDRERARDVAVDLLFSVPKGAALDDAAAALVPWADDPALRELLAGVVDDEEAPQGPGSRVEGACADLLLRTPAGARAVARRARRDREGPPIGWWAVRKLLGAGVPTGTAATVRLYARPGATVPPWLADELAAHGLATPDERQVAELVAEEERVLAR